MVSTAQITSRDGWNHGWVRDYALSVAVFTAGIPILVAGSLVPGTDALPEPVSLAVGMVLYLALFALLVLFLAVVDEQFAHHLPTVVDPTPNFRVGLVPATVVFSWVLALSVGFVVFAGLDSDLVAGIVWGIGGNTLAFVACVALANAYGNRYN